MAAMDTTADSATATLEDAELQAADAGEPVALGAAAADLRPAEAGASFVGAAVGLRRRAPLLRPLWRRRAGRMVIGAPSKHT